MVIIEILEDAGVEVHRGDGDEVSICCPFCGDRSETEDTRFRLGINVAKGLGHCYNCDWKGRGVVYIARQLCKAYGIPFKVKHRRVKDEISRPSDKALRLGGGLPEEYESFGRDEADPIGRKVLDYLKARQVSIKQIVDHEVGYAACGDMAWRAVFPVVGRDGKVHGCVGRAILPTMRPKYLNTPGMKMLWNTQLEGRTAVVAEGIFDALRVEQALLRTHGMVAVSRLGSAITSLQLDQLKEYEKVIVLPDNDGTGLHGATELCSRCYTRGIDTWVSIPPELDGRDAGDMSADEIMERLYAAIPWNKSTLASEKRMRMASLR